MLSLDDAVSDGFGSIEELKNELQRLNYNVIKDDTDVYIHKIENPINQNFFVKNGMYETRMDNKEIVGKCKQCGKCCRLQTYAGPYTFGRVKKFDEFLTLFGINQEIYDKLYTHPELAPGTPVLHKDIKCPNLRNDNTCAIYDNRPALCKEFPKVVKDFELLVCGSVDCGYSLQSKLPKKEIERIPISEFLD
jgi:Fe-S-cluster containining protein